MIPEPTALARITAAMDYDQSRIATTYDEARALTPARRRRWQRLLSAHLDRSTISLVVDLGCGTGRFSEMLAAELGARVIGLDPSKKMIDLARRKPATSPVVFGRASAHELPLPHDCVDLVFMSQIYHHLPDPAAVARECGRVLRAGGYVCIGLIRESLKKSSCVKRITLAEYNKPILEPAYPTFPRWIGP